MRICNVSYQFVPSNRPVTISLQNFDYILGILAWMYVLREKEIPVYILHSAWMTNVHASTTLNFTQYSQYWLNYLPQKPNKCKWTWAYNSKAHKCSIVQEVEISIEKYISILVISYNCHLRKITLGHFFYARGSLLKC